MAQPISKCPKCGGPTDRSELMGRPVQLVCRKCHDAAREAELARENLARKADLDRRWRETCPPLFRLTDPNHPAIDQDVLAKIIQWEPKMAGGKGIALIGPTGGCKTRMMFLLLRKLHCHGTKVAWIPAIELSRASSEIFDDDVAIKNKARRLLKDAARTEVLFIDDLGKERFTDRTELELYHLIETRLLFLRPILWTSNARGADLRELMSESRGPAITRRLLAV